MNKYRIKKTDILHNGKVYPEGSEIELSDEQALQLDNYLELMQELTKPQPAIKNTLKPKPIVEKQEDKPAEFQSGSVSTHSDITQNHENQQNTTKDQQSHSENNKNHTQNFVPPNMRRE